MVIETYFSVESFPDLMIPLIEKPGLKEPPEGSLPSLELVLRIIMVDGVTSAAKHVATWCKVDNFTSSAVCQVNMVA